MSAVFAPFGLDPIFHPSGLIRPQIFKNGLDPTVTQTMFRGTPVQLRSDGFIQPVTDATWDTAGVPPATAAGDDIIGVFNGVEFTDSSGRRRVQNFWNGPTTILNAAQELTVLVWTDPQIIYEIQANGSLAQATALGHEFQFSASPAPNAGSTFTGISSASLDPAAVASGSTGYVRVVNLGQRIDNDWGDAFTIVQVQIVTHEFVAAKASI